MTDTGERSADRKAQERRQQASVVEGLSTMLAGDEQLLGFARGELAGGWRGKLALGPEAFFAPDVNVGLTDRRLILQHIHTRDGRPSEILPHEFDLADIVSVQCVDVETFGGAPACRIAIRFTNDQTCRVRLRGQANVDASRALTEVFRTVSRDRLASTAAETRCGRCGHVLSEPGRFCPYCGSARTDAPASAPTTDAAPAKVEEPTEQQTAQPEPVAAAAVPGTAALESETADAEIEDEIHRFTEEGGSPAAVEKDDLAVGNDDLAEERKD
jgi:uncharacterized OB-fold protein